MQNKIENWNVFSLDSCNFIPYTGSHGYSSVGQCWKLASAYGEGLFWAYGQENFFDIKIHDFYFHEDTLIECGVSGYLSIFYYDSISGEQLTPYRRMNAGCIQSIAGNEEPYKILVHKKIPVRCIGIGISPAYYKAYLKKHFAEEYQNPYYAFAGLDQDESFPDLVLLLKQVKNYRGDGIAAKMFYEGKVAEVVSRLIGRTGQCTPDTTKNEISQQDLRQIETAVSYINDHYSCDIPLDHLTQIACMSATKFRNIFKKVYGCTITDYIKQRRLSHAECLLSETDLTIGQIANSVGYSTSSRLSALFRDSTGLTPSEYRDLAKRN